MLTIDGYEIPDNTPVEMPTRLKLPQSRAAQIQGYIRAELSRAAADQGQETFEEANDLDVEDNLDFGLTRYEQSAEFGYDDIATLTPPPADSKGAGVAGTAGPGDGAAGPMLTKDSNG